MTLTTKQQEKIVKLRAKSTMLNNELKNVTIPDVVFTSTKEQEIVNINTEIVSYMNHAGMSRIEYVKIVQPLKEQHTVLVQENEVIIQENNIKKQVAQQQYNDDIIIIQQQIDDNEAELLNVIKIVDLSKMVKI